MSHRTLSAACGLILVAALAACSEPVQTVTPRKVDTKPWEGPDNVYTANGWKAGDRANWEEQLRQRAQAQNDYTKVK
jgi:hypothetical protein